MPITATLDADFEDFYRETRKAEASLESLKQTGGTVGQPLAQSFASFKGATASAVAGFDKMVGGLDSVDRSLALMGINVTKAIGGLRELRIAMLALQTSMTPLGLAIAAVSAALLAWEFGPKIVGAMKDASQWIADTTAKLMDWGDVAAEVAGYKADMLARASQNAGRAITDLTEAMRINKDAAREMAEEQKKAAEAAAEATRRWRADVLKDWEADVERRNRKYQEDVEKRKRLDEERDEQRAREEQQFREFQNMLGERHLEDEGKRLQAEADAHAAMLAKKRADEEAYYATAFTVTGQGPSVPNTGSLIRGGPLAVTPGAPGGVVGFSGEGDILDLIQSTLDASARLSASAPPSVNVVNNFAVNGTGEEIARTVERHITASMKTGRKWPSA